MYTEQTIPPIAHVHNNTPPPPASVSWCQQFWHFIRRKSSVSTSLFFWQASIESIVSSKGNAWRSLRGWPSCGRGPLSSLAPCPPRPEPLPGLNSTSPEWYRARCCSWKLNETLFLHDTFFQSKKHRVGRVLSSFSSRRNSKTSKTKNNIKIK
jgi:hypothetical protein